MSTACKCNRCGVLYPRAKGNVAVTYSIDCDNEGGHYTFYEEGEEYDMCPACSEGFLDYVKHWSRNKRPDPKPIGPPLQESRDGELPSKKSKRTATGGGS